jgi:hypothetical protein
LDRGDGWRGQVGAIDNLIFVDVVHRLAIT